MSRSPSFALPVGSVPLPNRVDRRSREATNAVSNVAAVMLPHVASAVSSRFGFHLVAAARRHSEHTPAR